MRLKHITVEQCPHCGAGIVCDERAAISHTNGTRGEMRTFTCGCKLRYDPGLRQVEVRVQCSKSPEMVLRLEKRKTAYKALTDLLASLDVDESYRKSVDIPDPNPWWR